MSAFDELRWTSRFWRATLLSLTLVGFALRAYRLGAQNLWSDEDITLDRAGQALSTLVATLPVEHAPFYFVLMRTWTLLAGDGDLALRFPSLLAGTASVALLAFVGARLARRSVGLIAALIAAANPFLVWYGQEARMYSLVGALSLASVAAVLHADRTGKTRWWVTSGALAAVAVLTHYYAVLLVLVLGVWSVMDVARRGRAHLAGWIALAGSAALLFLPWFPRALGVLGFTGWRKPVALARAPWIALSAWSGGTTAPAGWVRWSTWLYVALAFVGLLVIARRARLSDRRSGPAAPVSGNTAARRHRFGPDADRIAVGAGRILAYALVPIVCMTALLLRNPDFHPRYLFAALPAFYLLVAAGAAALPKVPALVAVTLLALSSVPALVGLYSDPAFQKQDYRAVMARVEASAGPDDTALVLDGPPFGMMQRYRADASPVKIVDTQRSSFDGLDELGLDQAISERTADRSILWLAEDGGATGAGRRWMAVHACPVTQESVQDVTLGRYVHRPAPTERASADQDAHGDGEQGAAIDSASVVRAGEVLAVRIDWYPASLPPLALSGRDLKVSVRLVDRDGAVVAAADRSPANGTRPTSTWLHTDIVEDCHGLLVPPDVQPDDYELDVVLYEADTLRPIETWTDREPIRVLALQASGAQASDPSRVPQSGPHP